MADLNDIESSQTIKIAGADSSGVENNYATVTPDGSLKVSITGSEDGSVSGTQHVFVNNVKQQILASHDRSQALTYSDFGTKNQRVTQIDYTSATFPGVTARKTLTYLLEGNRYKRVSIAWSII